MAKKKKDNLNPNKKRGKTRNNFRHSTEILEDFLSPQQKIKLGLITKQDLPKHEDGYVQWLSDVSGDCKKVIKFYDDKIQDFARADKTWGLATVPMTCKEVWLGNTSKVRDFEPQKKYMTGYFINVMVYQFNCIMYNAGPEPIKRGSGLGSRDWRDFREFKPKKFQRNPNRSDVFNLIPDLNDFMITGYSYLFDSQEVDFLPGNPQFKKRIINGNHIYFFPICSIEFLRWLDLEEFKDWKFFINR